MQCKCTNLINAIKELTHSASEAQQHSDHFQNYSNRNELVTRTRMTIPDSQYKSCFPPSHSRLETTFIKFTHSRWSCLERLPGLDTISASISSSSYSKPCY